MGSTTTAWYKLCDAIREKRGTKLSQGVRSLHENVEVHIATVA